MSIGRETKSVLDTCTLTLGVFKFLGFQLVPEVQKVLYFSLLLFTCSQVHEICSGRPLFTIKLENKLERNPLLSLLSSCSVPHPGRWSQPSNSATLCLLGNPVQCWSTPCKKSCKMPSTSCCTYKYTLLLHSESRKFYRETCISLQNCPSTVQYSPLITCFWHQNQQNKKPF